MDEHLAGAIPVVVVNLNTRRIDGKLFEVRASIPVELRVEVREDASLQERIFRKVNTPDKVARPRTRSRQLSVCSGIRLA